MSQTWKDKPVKYLRDTVVDQLQGHLAENHLEIDEFEQRVHIALSTESKTELLALIEDLPSPAATEIAHQEQNLAPQTALYTDTQTITCILSESKRNGIWTPSKHMRALTVLGDAELDFRDVHLKSDVTYLSLECWLGELTIIVPPGINVVSQVKSILGAFTNASRGKMDPTSPTIIIQGKVVLGEVKIIEQGESAKHLD